MKNSSRGHEAKAWTHYWSKLPGNGGCLPDLPGTVAARIEKIWEDFFSDLPVGARLLDLGTGDGAILSLAQALRPDLTVTGIDYAAVPAGRPGCDATILKAMIEELPFADAAFDAITGQFALEYANMERAVWEVARVLAEDGRYIFLCHHAEGRIVRDNRERMAALRGLLSHTGLLDTAIKAVRRNKKTAPETRQRLARLFNALQRKYPGQSCGHEVATDIARIMSGPASLQNLLALQRDVTMEEQRLGALLKAAMTAKRARETAESLPFEQRPTHPEVIHLPGQEAPFAWLLTNRRQ